MIIFGIKPAAKLPALSAQRSSAEKYLGRPYSSINDCIRSAARAGRRIRKTWSAIAIVNFLPASSSIIRAIKPERERSSLVSFSREARNISAASLTASAAKPGLGSANSFKMALREKS